MSVVQPARARERLSIIVPVFRESEGLRAFHEDLCTILAQVAANHRLSLEVVYVDDGSDDGTADIARSLHMSFGRVLVVALSRNFGKESALAAGLEATHGNAVLFMDGDGQHPPSLILDMARDWLEGGFDIVYAAKADRHDEGLRKRLFSRLFYKLLNFGARIDVPRDGGDFRLMSPRAAAALRQLPERNRFFKGLSTWVGFRQKRIDYTPSLRKHGHSKFNPIALASLAIEGLTAFSIAPLRLATLFGLALAALAASYGSWIIIDKIVFGIPIPGYPSVVVGVMMVGAVQLVMIGILGEYIAKILVEVKHRPVFIVAETTVNETPTKQEAEGHTSSPS